MGFSPKLLLYAAYLASVIFFFSCAPIRRSSADETVWQVCFTPEENCSDEIVSLIETAKSTVFLQAYTFTSSQITNALLRAKKRGVRVEVILDKSARIAKYSSGDILANKGIPVFIDSVHTTAEDKVILIDEETVVTGSLNFTKPALEGSAGNLLILRHKFIVKKYLENWKLHKSHSDSYNGG
jgi:phosphatidylserine/phosphatidylglycerophosphate/cardiolipin synthase-like enzyme